MFPSCFVALIGYAIRAYIPPRPLTKNRSQVTLERLQDCHLDFLYRFAQKLLARRAKQLVGLVVKIIDVHHL